MTIYWLLIFWVVFGYFMLYGNLILNSSSLEIHKDHENMDKLYIISVVVFLICIIGLRASYIGIDTPNYRNYYSQYKYVGIRYILLNDEIKEKGFAILEVIFNRLGASFYFFNFMYAVFNVSVISYFIYKYSKIPWFSFALFILFDFFVLELTMMRQSMAMTIILIAVMTDKKTSVRSFLKFVLLVYIASLIHSSALICLPVWFVKRIKFSTKTLFVYMFTILIIYVFRGRLLPFASRIAQQVSEKYESYGKIQGGSMGGKLYLMVLATLLYTFIFKRSVLNDKKNWLFAQMLCCMAIIFPLVQIGGAVMRVHFYFYLFMIFFIPNMVADIKNDKLSRDVIILLYIALGLYMYYNGFKENFYRVVPYHFYWQSML